MFKDLKKKIKKSHNVALALFALGGLILNELLNLSVENTAIKMLVESIMNNL